MAASPSNPGPFCPRLFSSFCPFRQNPQKGDRGVGDQLRSRETKESGSHMSVPESVCHGSRRRFLAPVLFSSFGRISELACGWGSSLACRGASSHDCDVAQRLTGHLWVAGLFSSFSRDLLFNRFTDDGQTNLVQFDLPKSGFHALNPELSIAHSKVLGWRKIAQAFGWFLRNQVYPHSMLKTLLFAFASLSGIALAVDAPSNRGQEGYDKQIKPVLEKYCYDCHADGVKKGKFELDAHKDFASLRSDMKLWDHVRQMLVTHVMPPKAKPTPELTERDAVVKWIDDNVFWFDPAKPDPGHMTMRRLNRTEYNNTIRDLLQIYDVQPAEDFPQDDTGYGYDNIGDVLTISPLHMQKYMRAARTLTDLAMKVSAPERASIEIGAAKFKRDGKNVAFEDDGNLWLFSQAETGASFKVPADGTYRIVLHVAATKAGNEDAKIGVKMGGKAIGEYSISEEWMTSKTHWQKLEIELPISQGDHYLSIAFLNDFFDAQAPENRRDRNVAINRMQVEGPYGLTTPKTSKFVKWLAPDLVAGLPALEFTGEDLLSGEGTAEYDTGTVELATSGFVHHPIDLKEAGKYRFKVKLGAQQAGKEPVKFDVRLGDKIIQKGDVTAKNQTPQWFTFEADVAAGRHDLRVYFLNDMWDPKTNEDRNLWVHQLHIEGPMKPGGVADTSTVPALVKKLGDHLFRRPMNKEEDAQWQGLAAQATKDGAAPLETMALMLEGMLVSPSFLYHTVPTPSGNRMGESELIDEYTLAERLSYFLWSAPPDDALKQAASKGELRKNLAATVKRMVTDWRGASMKTNFAGQWLQLRDTDLINPSKRLVPEYEGSESYAMRTETQMFFDHILQGNLSVIDFLNADYTFVNKRLAALYKLPNPGNFKAKEFKQVSLAGTERGGVLTQGAILAITANPTRTSIVRRGKFVLESILGIPPPPAPGDVPPLDEKKLRNGNLTLRQQFEEHRKATSCAGCHALLDPIGFALENYDLIGRWRTEDNHKPVDTTGQWIRGQQFKNMKEFREIMVRDLKDDFVRCLAENLLTYALGRGLEYNDRPAVQEVVRKAAASGYRFQDMIIAVCETVPFQRTRVSK